MIRQLLQNSRFPIVPLGSVSVIKAGGTPSRRNPDYWNGSIPWIGTGAINFNWITEANEFITELGLKSSSTSIFERGTIVLAMIGQGATRGKVARLAFDSTANQNCAAIRPSARIDATFLFHYLAANYDSIRELGNSGGVSNLNVTLVASIPIALPPLEDQELIGRMAEDWHRAIDLMTQIIRIKRRLRRGVFQKLLSQELRFPVFKRASWQRTRLRDVTTESRETNGLGLDESRVMGVSKVAGIVPMRDRSIGADLGRYKVLKPRSFAYNPMRINIGSIAQWTGTEEVLVSPDYVVLQTMAGKLDDRFLDHYRRSHAWERYLEAAGNGSVRVRIYYDDLAAMSLNLPPIEEQRRIADFLDLMDHEISLLQRQRDLFETQKRSVIHKILLGDVSLNTN